MSTTLTSSLDTLPVELIHRIFTNLDEQTIILSLRYVCKRLYMIVNVYDCYKLNFESILKFNFDRICQFIQPTNVISLTLSDQHITPGQIQLFFSLFRIEHFTRLSSLTLIDIEDRYLKQILKHVKNCTLISLSIKQKDIYNRSKTTNHLLSTILKQPSLQKLTINVLEDGTDMLCWPMQCTISHLTLFDCYSNHFSIIFHHFSCLRTLFIDYCNLIDYDEPIIKISNLIPMRQLISLTMENASLDMDKIEIILSNTPALVHLRLIGDIDRIDFPWEKFIQTKLLKLNKFDFFLTKKVDIDYRSINIRRLITLFQTVFWLEIKHWFVTCELIRHVPRDFRHLDDEIRLYSIPPIDRHFEYHPDSNRIIFSTLTEMNNDTTMMDHIHSVYLETKEIMAATTKKQNSTSITRLFHQVSDLNIRIDSIWTIDCVHLISTLIDLSQIKKLELVDKFPQDSSQIMTTNVLKILEQACHVRSLIIIIPWLVKTDTKIINQLCSMIPSHIKHLEIDVGSMNHIKIILQRLDHLSSVVFRYFNDKPTWQTTIIEWLSDRRDLTYCKESYELYIWLGTEKMNMSQQHRTGRKRIKLTDHYTDS
ncbi:unnamed protein product [Rotaria sordida]|uniref:F-box domain-containing protein n=1 Tax=Rotaria sordida TaxID=392033 RepID=A0A815CFM0_9BILA|nr:unnamed protein product [Rotaria sordida]CAF4082244.1 unnamed protein product [Rotaria sordida]